MTLGIPPRNDELEVSIIGPGRGECIVVHLGDNEWCVVDSCVAREANKPAATEYLSLFPGAIESIKIVVATHWHDDHIRGLSSVLSKASNAAFYCSGALRDPEFKQLVASATEQLQGNSGLDEFAAIYQLILSRRQAGQPQELVGPGYAVVDRTLLSLAGRGRSFDAKVVALSPSDGSITRSLLNLGQYIPKRGEPQRRIPDRSANHSSVVLWIEAGPHRVLLGADLENTNRPGEGWIAVLSSFRDPTKGSIFKVPHHGSQNAHHSDVWTEMLKPNPVAVVTPFTAGVRLPRDSDLDRLKGHTSNLYCTSAGTGKPPIRDAAVEKRMKEHMTERRVLDGKPGQVRIRWSAIDAQGEPRIEAFNGAFQVS